MLLWCDTVYVGYVQPNCRGPISSRRMGVVGLNRAIGAFFFLGRSGVWRSSELIAEVRLRFIVSRSRKRVPEMTDFEPPLYIVKPYVWVIISRTACNLSFAKLLVSQHQ
jgi:hypothetical protein